MIPHGFNYTYKRKQRLLYENHKLS
uniref:Uncharacterized protein n=1 Tax=Anguilla anguilla TaxID=7936 RepID=A0A0E9PSL1_ANGAN